MEATAWKVFTSMMGKVVDAQAWMHMPEAN